MGLEVYYPDDIRNAILAAEQATNAAAEAGEVSDDYLAGYRAALMTIALAFGLMRVESQDWPQTMIQERRGAKCTR